MPKPSNDPARWKFTVLPLPKRAAFARIMGFCGGGVVGETEGRGGGAPAPHWWHEAQPAAIVHPVQKRVCARRACGDTIPGSWIKGGGVGFACGWRIEQGALRVIDLHPGKDWEYTIAMGSGGGVFAGFGKRRARKGQPNSWDTALLWRGDGTMVELPSAEPRGEASAQGTDGAWVVGTIGLAGGQRAALWPADGSKVISLGDDKSLSEAGAVGDGEQVGVRWTGRGSSPVLWRGSAESRVDLLPEGHEVGTARGCAGGCQVGSVQVTGLTKSGSSGLATKAALWSGDAASFFDLHSLVGEPWNASSAAAVEIRDGVLRIAGDVTQFGVANELTPRESQYLIGSRPALWETKLA
jgi:hypothetical protein